MWTVLFGEHDAPTPSPAVDKQLHADEDGEYYDDDREDGDDNQQLVASPRFKQQQGKEQLPRLSTVSTVASSPPPSPSNADAIRGSETLSLPPSPPTSQSRRASSSPTVAAPPLSSSGSVTMTRRGSRARNYEEDDDAQQTPMAMLLRRMNQLMLQVGEHEFEKKTLVNGMEKDRERLTAQIKKLELEIEDLKDQNVQLQYKLEFTTEPMLMEQLQDVTDMRDALSSVKIQLEKEIGEKDKEIAACKAELDAAIAAKEEEIKQIRAQYIEEIEQLEEERDDFENRAANATRLAEKEAEVKYRSQLDEKDASLAALGELRVSLESALQEKDALIEELQVDREVVAQQKHDEIAQLQEDLEGVRLKAEQDVESLKRKMEEAVGEKEEVLRQVRAELMEKGDSTERQLRERIEELEMQVSDSEAATAQMTQEIGDYKEDCVQLWKTNEDLKQQIALASAETMLRDAEMRENALSGQTALLDKVNELEYELKVMQEQLNEKTQELVKLQSEARPVEQPSSVTQVDNQPWKGGAIRILTDQVAAAQRELSDAMDLNLHLNNRNTWLEEQYKLLSVGAAASPGAQEKMRVLEMKSTELEQQLAEKQRFIQSFEENHKSVLVQFDQLQSAYNELLSSSNAAQEQIYQLTQEWQALNQEVFDLRNSNNALVQETESLKTVAASSNEDATKLLALQHELSQLQAQCSTLAQDLDASKASQDASLASLESIQHAEQELRAENDALKRKIEESNNVSSLFAEAQTSQNDLQAELSELKVTNGNLRQELESTKAAYSEAAYYAEQFRTVEYELHGLRDSHEKLLAEFNALQASYASVSKENEELKKRASEHESVGAHQISTLNAERDSLVQQLSSSQATVAASESKLKELAGRCEAQASHINSLEQQLKNLQESLQDNMEAAYESETKYEEALLDLDAVRKELQAKTDECMELQQAADSATRSAQNAASVHEDLEHARHEVAELMNQVEHLRSVEQYLNSQAQQLTATNEYLSAEIYSVKSERQTIEQELVGLKASSTQLETRFKEACEQAKLAEAARAELQRENDEVSTMLDADRFKVGQLQQQLDTTRAEHGQLHAQIESLTKKNFSLCSELESSREDAELKEEAAKSLLDNFKATQKVLKDELANLQRILQSKDAELSAVAGQSQGEIQRLQYLVAKYEEEKNQILPELNQLRSDIEQVRAAESKSTVEKNTLAAEIDNYRFEVDRLQQLVQQLEQEKSALEDQVSSIHALEEEKNQIVYQLQHVEQRNRQLEQSHKELEDTLEKSKSFCEDLSVRCEEISVQAQEHAKKIQEDSQAEIYRLTHANESLQQEIEKFVQNRFREASAEEELHLHIAELQAENNVLASRAHRLTQQLSQFTEVPEEDRLADSQSQTPDLWELLSSGMEQLKADLELAIKARRLSSVHVDVSSVDGRVKEQADRSETLFVHGLFVRTFLLAQRRQEASKDALLKVEEEKAWEKIEQTRKRATELLRVRENNDRSQSELRELAQLAERELQASIQAKRELVLSIDSIQKKKEMGMQITEARRCEALQLKEEKQKWKEFTEKKKRDELQDAIRRKEEIAMQKEALKTKKLMHKQEIEKMTKERAMEKVRAEEDLIRKREMEVQEMERMELELIQRLRNTQHLQKQAFEELEAALTGAGNGLHSPGKDPLSSHHH
ncbi:hypothetical protein FI667_g7963, partial [Globisporangium splendens]